MAFRFINMGGPVHTTGVPTTASNAAALPTGVTIRSTGLPHTDAQFAFVQESGTGTTIKFGIGKGDTAVTLQNYQGTGYWWMWETDGDALEDGDVVGMPSRSGTQALYSQYQSSSGKYRINTTAHTTGYDYSPDVWYKLLQVVDVSATRLKIYVNGSLALNETNAAYTGGACMGQFTNVSGLGEATGDGNKCFSLFHIVDSDTEADILPDWFVEFEQHDPVSDSTTYADGTEDGGAGDADFEDIDDWASGGSHSFGADQEFELLNAANQEQGFGLSTAGTTFRNAMQALGAAFFAKNNAASKSISVSLGIYDGANTDEGGLFSNIPVTSTTGQPRGDIFILQADGATAWDHDEVENHEVVLFRDADAATVEVAVVATWAMSYGNIGFSLPYRNYPMRGLIGR